MTPTTPEPTPTPTIVAKIAAVFTPQVRQYFYGVLVPIVALLVAYGIIDESQVALWLAFGGAILGNGTAFAAISVQRRNGLLP